MTPGPGRRRPHLPPWQELISVVIPTFNRAELVIEALDSVAAQTWRAVEIIVVDDGSTDQTGAALQAWGAAHSGVELRILFQRNRGPEAARNAGAAAARGAFLYFLDSDDLILPDALATLAAPLLTGAAPFSLAHIRTADLEGELLQGHESLSRQSATNCLASSWMMHAALYRRSSFIAAGPFDPGFRRGADTEHQWRVLATVGTGALVDRFIGIRRLHDRGHICADRTDADAARDNVAVMRRFLGWAEAHGKASFLLRRSLARRAAAAAVRAGRAGDWACHAEALSILSRADGWPSFARALLALRWTWLHATLLAVSARLKRLRDRPVPAQAGTAADQAAPAPPARPGVERLVPSGGTP